MREIGYDELLELMRVRYDFYSARIALERTLDETGLPAKVAYTTAEVRRIADQMWTHRRDRVDAVVAQLRLEASVSEGQAPRRARAAAGERNR